MSRNALAAYPQLRADYPNRVGVVSWLFMAGTIDPAAIATPRGYDRFSVEIPPPGNGEGIEMTTTTYTIKGMTCQHCQNAVSAELGRLPGVQDVQIDLAAGTATVTSEQPLDQQAVRDAVDEAGYELVS